MRIVGGKYGGRVIRPPKGLPVRPTTDQAKEALFNILEHRFGLEGAKVLDLFSGTGNMAYEFLSRGAEKVMAVDQNFKCIRFIQSQFDELGEEQAQTRRAKVEKFLSKAEEVFDLVFMDPPYQMPGTESLVTKIFQNGFLQSDGWLILEHASQDSFAHLPNFYELRKYGSSSFTFFKSSE